MIKKYDRVCPNCKKPFIAHRKDKVFCKPKCKYEYWTINKNK